MGVRGESVLWELRILLCEKDRRIGCVWLGWHIKALLKS